MAIDKKAKLKAVMTAMKQLEKSHKKEGICYIMGEERSEIETTPTSSIMFDIALGGGLPKGRLIEFFGAESSGKTLCATRAMAEVQKQGGLAALIDMEHAFDPSFASKLGLDCTELIFSQPDSLQEAFDVIDKMVDAGVDIITLDSVASLVPEEELNGEIGKQTIGLIARYMSQFLRRITPKAAKNGTTIIFINQVRDAIGVMYGDPTTTPGGKALKFYCSVRCRIAEVSSGRQKIKQGAEEIVVGKTIRATVVKNKVGMPYRKAEFVVYFDGRPVDKSDEICEVALLQGLIPKYGSDGNISATGRTYKISAIDESTGEVQELVAKKKDDVAPELRKYPAIQEHLLKIIKGEIENPAEQIPSVDLDSDMSEEDFENMMKSEDYSSSDDDGAEETSWDEV